MRDFIFKSLILLIITIFSLNGFGKNNGLSKRESIYKLIPQNGFKQTKANPMVIGPNLYDQIGEISGLYAISTEYVAEGMDKYSTITADDFVIPDGNSWDIEYIKHTITTPYHLDSIKGYNVFFYTDDNGKPGTPIKELKRQNNATYFARTEQSGAYDITLTLSEVVSLTSAGKYWLSVQVISDIEELGAADLPAFRAGSSFLKNTEDINSQAHIFSPGSGYFYFPIWTNMDGYWDLNNATYKGNSNFGFALYGSALQKDLALMQVLSLNTAGELGQEDVKVLIQNHGKTDILGTDYTLRFRIDGGTWTEPEAGIDVSSGAEKIYTFHDKADVSVKGEHTVEIELVYASDEYNTDNSISKTFENLGKLYKAQLNKLVEYTITECEGTLTDHGGLEDMYATSNDTIVLYPGREGARIRLNFYNTGMSYNDYFEFYNGSSTDAPLLGKLWTGKVNNLSIEGINPQGAITIVTPSVDVTGMVAYGESFNFMAAITCVQNYNTEFKISDIKLSNPYNWARETVELTAVLENRSLLTDSAMVTFFVNDVEYKTVSSTITEMGENSLATVSWTPELAGMYKLTAKIPADDANNPDDKEFSINKEVFEFGQLVESFEAETFPPTGWISKVPGATTRTNDLREPEKVFIDGEYVVDFDSDTLITPLLNIELGDSLKLLWSGGYYRVGFDLLFADNINGPWTKIASGGGNNEMQEFGFALNEAVGQNYLAIKSNATGAVYLDYVRGPKWKIFERDLMAISLENDIISFIAGQEYQFDFEIRNMGTANVAGADYTVKLWKKVSGKLSEIAVINGVDVSSANYANFRFAYTFADQEISEVFATIEYVDDQNSDNNQSNSKYVRVAPEGVEFIYVGYEETALTSNLFLDINKAYVEVIYEKENFKKRGEIKGITVFYSRIFNSPSEFSLYIGETDLTTLENGFLSRKNMVEVYDGPFEQDVTAESEFAPVYIPFDKPYLYTGEKNLVFSLLQPEGSGSTILETVNENLVQRGALLQNYHLDMDFTSASALNKLNSFGKKQSPNMLFSIATIDMDGSIAGTITNTLTDSLANVSLSLEGYANTTKTDSAGFYTFPIVPQGDVNVNAVKYGYFDQTKVGTVVSPNQTVVDFVMESLPAIEVSGRVIANDSLKPIEGVEVFMEGYDLYFYDQTDASGNFNLPGVYGDKEYNIRFVHPKFVEYTTSLIPAFENYSMGDVTLDEKETPAFNLIAELNDETGNVNLSWQAPYTGIETMVDPTLSTAVYSYWYNEPDEDVQLGNYFRVVNPGTVTSLEFTNFEWGTGVGSTTHPQEAELFFRFYNKDRMEIHEPVSFIMPDTAVEWLEIDVPDFTYTDDFYVMMHWNKVHQQTCGLASHIHDDNVAWVIDGNGDWILLTDIPGIDPIHQGAFSIRANVIEAGAKSIASKALLAYDVWRTNINNINDESQWVKLNSESIPASNTTTNYTDETFSSSENGMYKYVLLANYTLGNAPYLFSNEISKGLVANVTIDLSSNDNESVIGTKVALEHENGQEINSYFALATDTLVAFPAILKGNYTLTVSNGAGYYSVTENITINNDTLIPVELIERIMNPTLLEVVVDTNNQNAEFTWGLGDLRTYQVDDGTAEGALFISVENDAYLGNVFENEEAGQIISVDILGVLNNGTDETGKVSLVIFNEDKEIIGKSDEFDITIDDGIFYNVPMPSVSYEGTFYAMVHYSANETLEADAIGMDTDENPGNAYYYDVESGFVQLSTWNFWGNFMIRVNALVNGKKVTHNYKSSISNSNSFVSEAEINAVELAVPQKVKASNKSIEGYNVFLNDMSTPIAFVTDNRFVFTEAEHLTNEGWFTYKAGVQAVFATGTSIVVPKQFDYKNTVGISSILDKELKLYPNPANNHVTIEGKELSDAFIYNALGELVKIVNENSFNYTIDISDLPNGSYVVKVEFNKGTVYRNLIINK